MNEDKNLSWDKERDRLEIIKNIVEPFNSSQEGCQKIELGKILRVYIPWMIERIEKLESERCDHVFEAIDFHPGDPNSGCFAQCTKCGYRP